MALKKSLTDPLNWLLLVVAAAFIYYILAVPYFTDLYLKTPQEMTFAEYLSNPSHPRPFVLHALSAPPSSVEIIVRDLQVSHIDQDSILLIDPSRPSAAATPVAAPAAGDGDDTGQTDDTAVLLQFLPEAETPSDQILIAGDNLDLLPVSVGQTVDLRTHGLTETPLGWVPQNPELTREQEESFTKEEIDALEFMKLIVDGNETNIPYIEVGEMRFANDVHSPGEPVTLAELDNDTTYIQTVSRLAGGTIDLYDVRLVEKRFIQRAPYFVVEDDEGRRARVFFNSRLLSEWYWAMDRLQDNPEVVVRGTLQAFTPSALRQLAAEDNIQVVIDGYAILSRDGTKVINLENPLGGLGIGQ